ncbi:MAG: proton-conducting transporter membrane subunit [Hyphomicrobiaceae bacterium]
MALNGAVSHAFAHIIYKALLFMSMGAVLYRVGTVKASQLGSLYKSMPWTTVFCIIGAISIAGFPLTSGFVTKNLTLFAAEEQGYFWIWLLLIFASAGVMEHSGIKIPFFAFFSHDSGVRVPEAPANMLVAMGIAAAACIFIGVYPKPLYDILPYPVSKEPYSWAGVITKTQLLVFAIVAFGLLVRTGLYPKELPSTNLNTDWFYRKLGYGVVTWGGRQVMRFCTWVTAVVAALAVAFKDWIGSFHGHRRHLRSLVADGYDGLLDHGYAWRLFDPVIPVIGQRGWPLSLAVSAVCQALFKTSYLCVPPTSAQGEWRPWRRPYTSRRR